MLTKAQCREFFGAGYLVLPGLFRASEIAGLRQGFDRLERRALRLGRTTMHRGSQFVVDPAGGASKDARIHRIVWCGACEPTLMRFGRDSRLLRVAAQLLGSPTMCHLINQAHFKLPGDGVEFPWHQDSTHRRYGRGEWEDTNGKGSYVQTALAIDDVAEDNGPLQLIPGSCRLGHVEIEPGRLPDSLDPNRAVTVPMEAGSVLVFGPYTFHRSLPNRSSRPRRVFINGFAYPGANSRVYPGDGAGALIRTDDPDRRATAPNPG